MPDLSRSQLEVLLDRLERLEDPLLSWGVVDGSISEEEAEAAIEQGLAELQLDDDPDAVLDALDELTDRGLLLPTDDRASGVTYRTRMAEHMRLLRNLRQIFLPRGEGRMQWRGAPTLVDGFRYVRRPRQYPRRDQSSAELLESATRAGSPERDVLRTLTTGASGTPWGLAGFQTRATDHILQGLNSGRSAGAIVTAGTGSGKTLAFYLPAFTFTAGLLGGPAWTKVLALYPRNELLKDQLQSAVEQALRLREPLSRHGLPAMRVGALFGSVPERWWINKSFGWEELGRGSGIRVCPYLTCPQAVAGEPCHGLMTLDEKELKREEPELTCRDCGSTLPSDVFAITRDQMRRRPPDLVFSSTEMLNRALLDPETGHVMGIGAVRGPRLVLLDEAHTYGGASGAMTALTLRRWRSRVRSQPIFVGLSATLLDAPRYFGDLVGLHADRVTELTPQPDEMIPEGAEYMIIARADPTSRAAVLSTTIQASMLLGRTLDARGGGTLARRSRGLFGSRAFVFTDDLDVTNRLYFNLLDAEGQRHRRKGNQPFKPSLAHLRSVRHDETEERRRAGQVWDLAEKTGHPLNKTARLQVGRTSSQDAGVDENADLIVATASLEVGVDDPEVGAVLQHKAPRDSAAFLQRKGRAGRERGTRPITAVIVSDYGRDREAYERWDRLIDPALDPSALPVGNVHVLRMQAAMATLEWTALQDGEQSRLPNLWSHLAAPRRGSTPTDKRRRTQAAVESALKALLASDDARASLERHLMTSLDVDRDVARDLLWRPPRPVLLGAVPALLRRIADDWAVVGRDAPEDSGSTQPLPPFIPSSLFAPLALPEVIIQLPQQPWEEEPSEESMGVIQAVREFAPGRITRRFAVASDLQRAWTEPPDGDLLDVRTFVDVSQTDGELLLPDGRTVPLVRPLRLHTTQPMTELLDSSHSAPMWHTQLVPSGPGSVVELTGADALADMLGTLTFHLHRNNQPIEARRGAVSFDLALRFEDGSKREATFALSDEGQSIALGATFDVDALRVCPRDYESPDAWDGQRGHALRTQWLYDSMLDDETLTREIDVFLVDRLSQLLLLTLLRSSESGESLAATYGRLDHEFIEAMAQNVSLLLAYSSPDDGEDETSLSKRLSEALEDANVQHAIRRAAPRLWEAPDEGARTWLRRRLLRTVGEAILAAARLLCPEHDPERVVVDVEPAGDPGAVWVSETDIGGGGFLEALADAVATDPARFQRLVHAALRPGPDDLVAGALERAAMAAVGGTAVTSAFATYRGTHGATARLAALDEVREALRRIGVGCTPEVVSATVNRLLRSGSDAALDALVAQSLTDWKAREGELGIEIPVRLWSLLQASSNGQLDRDRHERLQVVHWPRGSAVRDRRLASYNPFARVPDPSPDTLLLAIGEDETGRILAAQGWEDVQSLLQDRGTTTVIGEPGRHDELLDVVARATVDPIDLGYLRLHARPSEVRLTPDDRAEVRLELPDLGRHQAAPAVAGNANTGLRTRRIHTGGGSSGGLADVLHAFFASELLSPSSPLWIVSAWLSDVPIVDNRGGELLSLAPSLPIRRVRLIEVLTEIVSRGGDVRVIVRQDELNRPVVARLRELETRTTAGRLRVVERRDLHDKVLASDRLLIEGSMNLTHRGSSVNEEGVRIIADTADVAAQRMELRTRFEVAR